MRRASQMMHASIVENLGHLGIEKLAALYDKGSVTEVHVCVQCATYRISFNSGPRTNAACLLKHVC